MKRTVEKRKPNGPTDHVALTLTTWGVGYIPGAPGTYASAIAVAIYIGLDAWVGSRGFGGSPPPADFWMPAIHAAIAISLLLLCMGGVWASGRSIPLLGNDDPPQAVVDEVMGQLITFLFIPFGLGWPYIVAGFLLFRLFDIWKPYPINDLQVLPGGIGICADDIVAGVYAGICLATGYAVTLLT